MSPQDPSNLILSSMRLIQLSGDMLTMTKLLAPNLTPDNKKLLLQASVLQFYFDKRSYCDELTILGESASSC